MNHFIINTNFHLKYFYEIAKYNNLKSSKIILIVINIRDKKLDREIKNLSQSYKVIYIPFLRNKILALCRLVSKIKIINGSNGIFLANPKSLLNRILFIFSSKDSVISTFDDGSANLLSNGYFQKKENPLSKLIGSFFKKIDYEKICERITVHYTFFNREIYFPTNTRIKRLDYSFQQRNHNSMSKKNILLLPSYYDDGKWLTSEQEIMFIKEAIKKFDIDKILPHPSNSLDRLKKNNLEIENLSIDSIDYIIDNLSYFDMKIYGFRTTTLILLHQLKLEPNIKCFNIQIGHLNGKQLMSFPDDDIWSDFKRTITMNINTKIK